MRADFQDVRHQLNVRLFQRICIRLGGPAKVDLRLGRDAIRNR